MKERLQKLLTDKNLSSTEFAKMIGVQPSTISHILSGRNKPGFDFIQSLLNRFTDVNATWLITGHGAMYIRDMTAAQAQTPQMTDQGLFSGTPVNQAVPERRTTSTAVRQEEKKTDKKVSRVVLYYDDKTYEEFLPA